MTSQRHSSAPDGIFDAAAAGFVQTDGEHRIRHANQAFATLLGCPAELLVGRSLCALVNEEDADAHSLLLESLRSGSMDRGRLELRYAPEPERAIWADAAYAALRDERGEYAGALVTALDIGERKRQEALQLQRHGLALQASGLGLWEWHVQTGLYQVDMFWAMTLGYAVAELQPHIETLRALEHPDDTAAISREIETCLRGETAEYTGEHRLRHKEGHWVCLLERGLVVERDEHGRPRRVLGTSQDITARRAAEAALLQSQKRQGLALSSARLGQWDWDIATGEMTFDDRFNEIVGYLPGELERDITAWKRLDHPEDAAMIEAQLEAHLRGETDTYFSEHRILHKSGRAVWVHGTGMVVERDAQGLPLRMVGLHKDISQRKQDEADLRAAKDAADSASRAKSMFLANMSHEIRTPLNAVLGLTRVVLDSELTTRQRDFLQKVHASSKSLLGILNDILDHSKIEAGHMALETLPFPIEEPLNSVASLFGAQVEQKGLELFFEVAPDVPMEVVGDPMRLTQVLNNLVGNAIKFTERGEIRLKAEVARREAGSTTLRLSVTDTGIGLSAEQAARLFQAFTQADNSVTRKYGGTGLGLTISRQLVQLMGGDIEVESAPGQGCTFSFTARFQDAPDQHLKLDLHRVRGLRALVVDDQETSRLILANLFDAWGMQADTAATAEEGLSRLALSRAQGRPYDVVLLDWRMPGMDGVEMARRMRSESAPGACPPYAIMVTAFGRDQLMSEGRDLGLDVVLTKPVVPSALFDILMRLRHPEGAPVARHAPAAGVMRFDGAHVLLVEDNLLNQEVAAEFLHGLGARVTIASHGAQALDLCTDEHFDLVLMDMHMPVMDGLTAARQIVARGAARAPIVAMTAAVLREDRASCAEAGMSDFVAKPVDPDELVRVLRRWLPAALVVPTSAAPVPAPAEDTSLLPVRPDFDAAAALRRLHGNRDQLTRLLRSFAARHGSACREVEALLANGALEEARGTLHTLKGIAATLSLVGTAAAALAVERDLAHDDGPAGSLQADLADLGERLAAAITAIDAIVDDQAPDAQPLLTLDRATVAHLLADLRRYVSEQELIPDALLDEFKRMATIDPLGTRIATLLQHVFDFDHAAALVDIDEIGRVIEVES